MNLQRRIVLFFTLAIIGLSQLHGAYEQNPVGEPELLIDICYEDNITGESALWEKFMIDPINPRLTVASIEQRFTYQSSTSATIIYRSIEDPYGVKKVYGDKEAESKFNELHGKYINTLDSNVNFSSLRQKKALKEKSAELYPAVLLSTASPIAKTNLCTTQ